MDYNPLLPSQLPRFLYRVIRTYDVDPETGFQCGNPIAGLTFEQHVKKGFDNIIKSQYISTTKSSRTAISWTLKEHSSFAIISCQALDQGIYGYDLSANCSAILDKWSNDISTRHQEILLTPYINEEAIVGIVSFKDCPSRDSMNSCVQRLLGLCGYCNRRGHSIDHCEQLAMDWVVDEYSSTRCGYCNEPGHDIDRGDRCEELAVDCLLDEYYSTLCGYCDELGHNIDRGDHCEKHETDRAVEEYYSTRCGYCDEPGHDANRGDHCKEREMDHAVEEYCATHCGYCGEPGHNVDNGDHCIEFDFEHTVVDFHSLQVS